MQKLCVVDYCIPRNNPKVPDVKIAEETLSRGSIICACVLFPPAQVPTCLPSQSLDVTQTPGAAQHNPSHALYESVLASEQPRLKFRNGLSLRCLWLLLNQHSFCSQTGSWSFTGTGQMNWTEWRPAVKINWFESWMTDIFLQSILAESEVCCNQENEEQRAECNLQLEKKGFSCYEYVVFNA